VPLFFCYFYLRLIPAGLFFAAVKRGTIIDFSLGVTFLSLPVISMPLFWWALLLMLVFSVNWLDARLPGGSTLPIGI